LDTQANAAFLPTAWRLTPELGRISAFFVQAYAAVHMIARGAAAAGNDAAGVLDHAKRSAYAAPSGPLQIHAETNHAILAPRIARARADGVFDLLTHGDAPVVPDPYLVRSIPAARPAGHLRVVK
jgi:branched-chain amino acid transport system substrate-binding protein